MYLYYIEALYKYIRYGLYTELAIKHNLNYAVINYI